MSIDDAGWADLRVRLAATGWPGDVGDRLVEHLTRSLVGHFGADVVECPHGKNDPTRHSMAEVAAASIAHLAAVIEPSRFDTLSSPPPAPWHDEWRTDPRTASWRS